MALSFRRFLAAGVLCAGLCGGAADASVVSTLTIPVEASSVPASPPCPEQTLSAGGSFSVQASVSVEDDGSVDVSATSSNPSMTMTAPASGKTYRGATYSKSWQYHADALPAAWTQVENFTLTAADGSKVQSHYTVAYSLGSDGALNAAVQSRDFECE